MAEKDTIVIPVTLLVSGDGSGGGGSGNGTNPSPEEEVLPSNAADENQKQADAFVTQKNAAKALAASVARQTVSLAFQQAGDFTGDYVAAQNVQFFVNEFSDDVQGLAGSVAAMGPWGALIWGIGETVKAGFHAYNYHSDIKKSEAQAKFNQQRVYGTTRKS